MNPWDGAWDGNDGDRMNLPKVSVLMSVYNGRRHLREAVESILGQDFADFEFIVVNDGSADATPSILAEYAARDSRIVLVHNPENIGLTRSLNRGLALARGRYVARQDADDVSLPGRLAREAAYLDEHPQAGLVSADYELADAEGRVYDTVRLDGHPAAVRWHLLFYNYVGCHSLVMFRREPVLGMGGYDESLRYSQDYDLWVRLAERGPLAILPQVLLRHRVHPGNITAANGAEQESISLGISRRRLERLTGRIVSADEAGRLRAFWLYGELAPSEAPAMNATLQAVCAAFLAELARQQSLDAEAASAPSAAIVERFISAYESQWDSRGAGYRACLAERDAWRQHYQRLAATVPVKWMLSARRLLLRVWPAKCAR